MDLPQEVKDLLSQAGLDPETVNEGQLHAVLKAYAADVPEDVTPEETTALLESVGITPEAVEQFVSEIQTEAPPQSAASPDEPPSTFSP